MPLLLLTACEPATCTLEAVSSLTIMVERDGSVVEDAEVVFSVDGGDFDACENLGDSWVCGWEIAGDSIVRASAPGSDTVERSYAITSDICHVDGKSDTIELETLDCTGEAVVSASVAVNDGSAPIPGASVRWRAVSPPDGAWTACDAGPQRFACAYEVSGELELEASAPGFVTATTTVTIEQDVCHVLTEDVDITLAAE